MLENTQLLNLNPDFFQLNDTKITHKNDGK